MPLFIYRHSFRRAFCCQRGAAAAAIRAADAAAAAWRDALRRFALLILLRADSRYYDDFAATAIA